jgi:hypothetical protein
MRYDGILQQPCARNTNPRKFKREKWRPEKNPNGIPISSGIVSFNSLQSAANGGAENDHHFTRSQPAFIP